MISSLNIKDLQAVSGGTFPDTTRLVEALQQILNTRSGEDGSVGSIPA
jgi:bacteriocin-like protein